MPSDPKGDALRVDGPTRDAIIEALRAEAGLPRSGYETADFIASRFPVSAEPSDRIEWWDEPITVTLPRRQWEMLHEAASSYDVRIPREQGDGGVCLDAILAALDASAQPESSDYIEWWDEPEKNTRWYRHVGCDGRASRYMVPLDDCPPPGETAECANCCHVRPLRAVSAEPSPERCPRDSDWCDGVICREHGIDCPNAEPSPDAEDEWQFTEERTDPNDPLLSAPRWREALELALGAINHVVGNHHLHGPECPCDAAMSRLRVARDTAEGALAASPPAESTYEWRAVAPGTSGEVYPLTYHIERDARGWLAAMSPDFRRRAWLERRTAPGPWERVPDDEGRRG